MLPPFFSNKPYWLQLCYLLLFLVGGVTIMGSLSLLIGQFLDVNSHSRSYLYITQFITSFGVFLIPALLFSYCAEKKWFYYSNAHKMVDSQMVGYVLVLSFFILPVIAYVGYLNEQIILPESLRKVEIWMREMEESAKMLTLTLTKNSNISILLVNIILMALTPAIFEEFLFRGTMQPFFTKWFGNKPVAIVVTAFIFSAIHFQFYGFIPRFLLGIYLGYLLIWGKSLWLPIIAHFMHNAASLILDFSAQKRNIDLESLDPTQIKGFYQILLFSTLFVGLGLYWMWRNRKKH